MMNQTHSQTLSLTADQILYGIAKGIRKKDRNDGDTLVPVIDDCKDFDWDFQSSPEAQAIYNTFEKKRDALFFSCLNTMVDGLSKDGARDFIVKVGFIENADESVKQEITRANEYLVEAMFFRQHFDLADIAERVKKVNQTWLSALDIDASLKHPIEPMIRAWQQEQTHRTIKTATVDQAQALTTIPYAVSEVNRRRWEIAGSVDAIEVDGEPIVTHINQLPGRWVSDDAAWESKAYKPKNASGDLMPMPTQRDNIETPIPLVAYTKWGDNLKASLASDVAQLMSIAYAANEPLILSVKDGASLLSRGQDGELRRPRTPDERRFERAFSCVHGMAAWIEDERGIPRFYPLTACDRLSDNRVSIAAANWARDRKKGRWTLTAGFGVAGQNRLKGNAHKNNVWRVVTGVEYWLARERFAARGPHKKFSQAMIPASGTTGPGNWYTLNWQELMMIAGDVWDLSDKSAKGRAYKRFQKVRDALIQDGYQVKNLNTSAEAGDTVEFLFEGKDGKLKVRATERFVEGAKKANRHDWQTVNLSDFLGF